ncbi:uncharacterized protein LOC144906894 [Branchiostoma floridae x Branchiostoma belcheri]
MIATNGSLANTSTVCPYVWEVGVRNISATCCSAKDNQSDTFYLDFGYDTTSTAIICCVVAILLWAFSVVFYLKCKYGWCFCRKIQNADPDLSGADDDLDDPLWWEKRRIFFDVFRLFATLLVAMHFFPIPSINLNITATIAIIPLVTLDGIFFVLFLRWQNREELIKPLKYYVTFYVVITGFPIGTVAKFVVASYYDDPEKIPLFAMFLPHGILFYSLPLIALVYFVINICHKEHRDCSVVWTSLIGKLIFLAAWVLSMVGITYYVWPQSLPYITYIEYLAPCTLSQALAPMWLLLLYSLVVTHCYIFSGIVKGGSAKSAALHLAPDLLHLYGICCTAVILTFYYDQHLESAPGIDQYMKPFWPLLLADLLGITGVLLILCRNRYRCSTPNRPFNQSVSISLEQLRDTTEPSYSGYSLEPLPSFSHVPEVPASTPATSPPEGQTMDHLAGEDDAAKTAATIKDPVCDYQSACERFQKSLGIDDSYFSHEQDKCFCEACHKARGDKDSYSRGEPEKTYAMPVGWTRFGLSLNPTFKDSELNVFDNWHRAYHGTHPDAVKKILQNSSQLLMPGDVALGGRKLGEREGHFNPTSKPEGFDTAQVFVTPSIVYAGLDAYASPQRFEDDGKVYKARVAFQLCIRPNSYTIGPETVGARSMGETIDPLFSNDELEWSTKERGGTALYGLLVKLEPFVDDSDGVDIDESTYAKLRLSKTLDMLYLLGVLSSVDGDYDFLLH